MYADRRLEDLWDGHDGEAYADYEVDDQGHRAKADADPRQHGSDRGFDKVMAASAVAPLYEVLDDDGGAPGDVIDDAYPCLLCIIQLVDVTVRVRWTGISTTKSMCSEGLW